MKIKLINFVLLVFAVSEVFSQQAFTIQVKNQKNEIVEYPEISIPKKTHKIGTKEGILLLPNININLGDSIIVSHLGYDTEIVLVDNEMINQKRCEIILYEKTYFLEPVIVNRNDFNAEAFFKKKKKNYCCLILGSTVSMWTSNFLCPTIHQLPVKLLAFFKMQ